MDTSPRNTLNSTYYVGESSSLPLIMIFGPWKEAILLQSVTEK